MVLEYLTALISNSPEKAQYMIPTVQRQRSATYALQEGRHGTLFEIMDSYLPIRLQQHTPQFRVDTATLLAFS